MVQHGACRSLLPSALRMALRTGPGPEGGGSKNSMSRPHWPERAGRGAVLSAAVAGGTNAAAEKTSAIVLNENRRGERTRISDISSSVLVRSPTLCHDLRRHEHVHHLRGVGFRLRHA